MFYIIFRGQNFYFINIRTAWFQVTCILQVKWNTAPFWRTGVYNTLHYVIQYQDDS